jgi:membrane fusion protein (multidrug efflux system)
LQVAASGEREAVLEVPERFARHLAPGGRFPMHADAYPDVEFQGEIIAVVPIADERSRNLRLRASLVDAPEGLIAGMFVRGDLPVVTRSDTALVPVDAVTLRDDKRVVFTVEGDTVEYVPVRTGLEGDGRIEIVEPLLASGTRVVTTGGEVLYPGAKVKVSPSSQPAQAAN